MKIILCLAVVSSLLLWPACNVEVNSPHPSANNDEESARRERQMYRDRAQTKRRELDRQIDALRERIRNGTKEQRRELERQMPDLDQRREIARQKLERLETSSQEAWADMKSGIDAAMDDLEAACKRANSHFQ
jgi:hypothetical protein